MCGYSNTNWIFSLTMVLMFAVLMVASVVFLVRSFNQKPDTDGLTTKTPSHQDGSDGRGTPNDEKR
jgi:hypothetical protein